MDIDFKVVRDVAEEMAEAARAVILPLFRNVELSAENKDDRGFDPVTEADRAAERAMLEVLSRRCPEDGVLGEEYGNRPSQSGLTWVLDPIDGTRGFISGTPTWGVLIALSNETGPIFGIIDQPFTGERFIGGGKIAETSNPHWTRPLAVRKGRNLAEATLFTTFPEVGSVEDRAGFEAVAEHVRLIRYGCDCYAYALLAAGQIDLIIEAGLNAYDIQAPIAVIEAAGGIVTDWQGGPAHEGGRALAAATPELHAEALAILKEVP